MLFWHFSTSSAILSVLYWCRLIILFGPWLLIRFRSRFRSKISIMPQLLLLETIFRRYTELYYLQKREKFFKARLSKVWYVFMLYNKPQMTKAKVGILINHGTMASSQIRLCTFVKRKTRTVTKRLCTLVI